MLGRSNVGSAWRACARAMIISSRPLDGCGHFRNTSSRFMSLRSMLDIEGSVRFAGERFCWGGACDIELNLFGGSITKRGLFLEYSNPNAAPLPAAERASIFPLELSCIRRPRKDGEPLAQSALELMFDRDLISVRQGAEWGMNAFHLAPSEKCHRMGGTRSP